MYRMRLALVLTCNMQLRLYPFDTQYCYIDLSSRNFSGIQARFTLRRQNGYHLLQTYVPTIIIVCMSWLSFWIEPDHVPGRVTLCVTTLLTLTTLAGGVRQSLPRVSYVKAVDVWLVVCMLMVFAVLIEFTVVNSLATRKKDPRLYKSPSGPMKMPSKTYISQARRIDEFSRALFPAFFFLFNVFYWTYYILRLYQEVNKTPFTY
ncbi:hypothetical protein HAZT_HAZT002840 [Hyalella azteca]|uniref:Neurotransmitter-gated ion-channel transmembrane domain-containing protein n=1 Tax=Hyalella azteca TaxID=294128 RepID=A0A6A0GXL7_HYAAZ|nr:hypothetical protein HAZT_HAZT002840 [Hyalella azteca]